MDPMDPSAGVARLVKQWHLDTVCWPTWEELLEVEYLRRFGNINMFTDDVVTHCKRRGLTQGESWLQRLKDARVLPSRIFGIAVNHYEQTQGPQDSWLTAEIIDELQRKR